MRATLGPFIIRSTLLSEKPRDYSILIAILSVMIMFFVSVLAWQDDNSLYASLAGNSEQTFVEGEYWRLVTGLAVHADFKHFLSNAVLFGLFSYLLYGYFGFWIYPFAAVAMGSLTNYLALLTYAPQVRLVGSSGVVYWMAGFWLTMYMLIERRYTVKRRLLHGVGVGLILLVPSALKATVSYRSHAIGLALGIGLAAVYFMANKHEIRAAEVLEYDEDYAPPGSWPNDAPIN
jgi:rhomboid protease GluP